jgi:hypothetical protein
MDKIMKTETAKCTEPTERLLTEVEPCNRIPIHCSASARS